MNSQFLQLLTISQSLWYVWCCCCCLSLVTVHIYAHWNPVLFVIIIMETFSLVLNINIWMYVTYITSKKYAWTLLISWLVFCPFHNFFSYFFQIRTNIHTWGYINIMRHVKCVCNIGILLCDAMKNNRNGSSSTA